MRSKLHKGLLSPYYSILFALLSIACLVGSCALFISYEFSKGLSDRMAADGSADLYTASMHQRVRFLSLAVSVFFGACGFVMLVFKERCTQLAHSVTQSVVREIRVDLPSKVRAITFALASESPIHVASLTIIVFTGGMLRWHYMNLPLRTDEAYTYLMFASKPLLHALSDYTQPNNHLFHTLLVHASAGEFPSSTVAIRLPAFVFGVLMPLIVYVYARTVYEKSTGLIASALASSSFALVFFSVNAGVTSSSRFYFSCSHLHSRP